jgi:dihydropteroate synthase
VRRSRRDAWNAHIEGPGDRPFLLRMSALWQCGRFQLPLAEPLIMGIVNVTPDSFSDGGASLDPAAARATAERLIDEGADILDIGGESTRPGAADVDAAEELRRVVPLVASLRDAEVPVSVDTSKPEVMRAVLTEGAAIINDVRALQAPGALEAVARSDCGIVLMHLQGSPRTMQAAPTYADVVRDVGVFLRDRRDALLAAGVAAQRIALDPGFGFGKTLAHNLDLLARLDALAQLGQPVLVGLSRKSMLGELTERPVDRRIHASVAAALLAVERGARIVRVHDVAATRDALRVWAALRARQRGDD